MRKSKKSMIISYVILIVMSVIDVAPFIWMVLSSFKSQQELFAYPPTLWPLEWHPENYVSAWNSGSISFGGMFLNTMKIVIPTVVIGVLVSSLAAYAFARINFKGRDTLFALFLASMMVPGAVTMIPSFIMFRTFGWYNTFLPLIIPGCFGSAFAIFLLRQFFMTIPGELEEAARIDGCGRLRIWFQIFMPLSKPILATLIVFSFQGNYNDLMGPLIYLSDSTKFTVQLGLATFRGMFSTRYDLLMAGSVFCLIPILVIYMCAQKYFVSGIVMTGLKG
jgi:multiple sugar transport system permease protein